ncbi:methyltransferase [Candidatus Woesearchaeota archaeon]|nr:methyltransferase [Candidatus Woesearchaeota archaeon]
MKGKNKANKAEHYYTKQQTSRFEPKKIGLAVAGLEFEMYTAGGVFSPKKLDLGTKLLIEHAEVADGWKVLDLGCGYGAVGVAVKKKVRSAHVVMSDVNTRAAKLANMNLKLNRIAGSEEAGSEVLCSDGFQNKKLDAMRFDTILLNPPQTAGKQVCFRLIEESYEHLNQGGLLQLVARHQKGGKTLSKKMEEVFGNVKETAKGSGFRVYVSERK